jgi:uncharacterized protein
MGETPVYCVSWVRSPGRVGSDAKGDTDMSHRVEQTITLRVVPGIYGIARMAQDAPIPSWASGPGFSAMIRADDELTLVCLQNRIPDVGPFSFSASGIVLSIIAPLSAQDIGIFVVCTFDGEHVLVADQHWEASLKCLEDAGHLVID